MISPRLLPGRFLRQARDRAARVPGDAVGAAGAGLRGLGEHHLRRVMAFPPARRAILEAIFRQIPRQLDRQRAVDVELAARWIITRSPGADADADVYDLAVAGGRARVTRGSREPVPPVTITVDGVRFLRLLSGDGDPMRAYLSGDLAATGDIMAAARLVSLFRLPGARKPRKQNVNTDRRAHPPY
ncbi:MAG TPA: SCP2 sterol-binding domain-containing protein [Solirubrobacteraceae bacterium]|nr:SCP2 sterol-binding domain-containing protein [Solirubrobacteraceae bacterium]